MTILPPNQQHQDTQGRTITSAVNQCSHICSNSASQNYNTRSEVPLLTLALKLDYNILRPFSTCIRHIECFVVKLRFSSRRYFRL